MSARFYKNGSLWFIHPDTALSPKSVVTLFVLLREGIKTFNNQKTIDTLTRYHLELSDIMIDFSEIFIEKLIFIRIFSYWNTYTASCFKITCGVLIRVSQEQ